MLGLGADWCLTSQNNLCASLLLMGREVAAPFLKSSSGGLGSLGNWINSVLLLNK